MSSEKRLQYKQEIADLIAQLQKADAHVKVLMEANQRIADGLEEAKRENLGLSERVSSAFREGMLASAQICESFGASNAFRAAEQIREIAEARQDTIAGEQGSRPELRRKSEVEGSEPAYTVQETCVCWGFDHPPCPVHPNATKYFKAVIGILHPGCAYYAVAGSVCNKCGQLVPAQSAQDTKDEK